MAEQGIWFLDQSGQSVFWGSVSWIGQLRQRDTSWRKAVKDVSDGNGAERRRNHQQVMCYTQGIRLGSGFFFQFLKINFNIWVFFLKVYLNTMCMSGAQGGQKKVLDTLELELQTVVGHHVVLG